MVSIDRPATEDRCFFCSRPLGEGPTQIFMGLGVHTGCYQVEVDNPGGRSPSPALRPDPSYLFVPLRPLKNPSAVELGRRGGLKGGRARAAKLSASRRREIARRAARARWAASRMRRSA